MAQRPLLRRQSSFVLVTLVLAPVTLAQVQWKAIRDLDPHLAHDSTRNKTVLFGPSSSSIATQTWELASTGWNQAPSAVNPSGGSYALIYDQARGKTVVVAPDG